METMHHAGTEPGESGIFHCFASGFMLIGLLLKTARSGTKKDRAFCRAAFLLWHYWKS